MWRVIIGGVLIITGLGAILGVDLWHYFWPALLVLIGVWFLIDGPRSGGHHSQQAPRWQEGETVHETAENALHYSAIFQGINRKVTTDDFKGGILNTTFGGINLDLRSSKIKSKDPISLKVDATLGGIKIMVPKTWKIVNHVNGFVGGVSDSTSPPGEKEKTATLKIFGQATLSEVEITN